MTTKNATPKPIGDLQAVRAYCATMDDFHRDADKWLPFRIPQGTAAARFGKYGCCRTSERADYESGGADFNVEPAKVQA